MNEKLKPCKMGCGSPDRHECQRLRVEAAGLDPSWGTDGGCACKCHGDRNRRAPTTIEDALSVPEVRALVSIVQWVKDCGSPYQSQMAATVLAPFLAAEKGTKS